MRKTFWIISLCFLWTIRVFAADTVLTWPADGKNTMLRFNVGKLREVNSGSGQSDLLGEAVAENLSSKAIPSASFYLYLLDKHGKRVGEGYLEITNLPAGQRAKVPVSVHAMGSYAAMELQPQHLPSDEPTKVKVHVKSVPLGADVKVDSQDSGVTPQVIPMAPGKHVLEFSKEGYAAARTPVDVAESSMPAAVEVDLKPLTVDTVVLLDGKVLLGSVTSMSGTSVSINVKGKTSEVSRSRVARIVLGQRTSSNGGRSRVSSK